LAATDKRAGLSVRAYTDHRKAKGLPGCNKSAVQKALKDRRIFYIGGDSANGLDPATADRDWIANTNPAHQHPAAAAASREALDGRVENGLPAIRDPSIPDYTQSRARREHYEAELKRLDLAERLGHLVRTEVVTKIQQAIASNVRQQLLILSPQITPVLISAAFQHNGDANAAATEVEGLLEDSLRAILMELQADPMGPGAREVTATLAAHEDPAPEAEEESSD